MTTAIRSPQEVFEHQGQALEAEDLDGIVSDYSDDAVVIYQGETYRGKDGVRRVFSSLLSDLPHASWELPTITFADDVLYVAWTAHSADRHVDDGADTVVFRDGQIRAQTIRYTLQDG